MTGWSPEFREWMDAYLRDEPADVLELLDRRAQIAGEQLRRLSASTYTIERAVHAALRGDHEELARVLGELDGIELERVRRAGTLLAGEARP